MRIRKTGATRGARWLNDSIHIIEKHPRPILLGALTVSAIATLPGLLGPLAMFGLLVLVFAYPVLMGGLVAMAHAIRTGRPTTPGDVFAGFRNGRAGALMWMAVPQLLFGIVVVLMLVGTLGPGNLERLAQGQQPDVALVNQGALPWAVLVMVLGGLATFSATLLGVPLAMLDGVPGPRAIATSLRAAMTNPGAILIYVACLVVAVIIASIALFLVGLVLGAVLGLLGPAAQGAGQLVLGILLNAGIMVVLACGHLLAWRDVVGPGAGPGNGDAGSADPAEEVSAEL